MSSVRSTIAGDLAAHATLELRVLREHVASVYASHTTAIGAHLAFATALVLFGWPNMDPSLHPPVGLWYLSVAAVDLYALLARRWTPETPMADSPYWARKYTVLVTLTSLATAPASFSTLR